MPAGLCWPLPGSPAGTVGRALWLPQRGTYLPAAPVLRGHVTGCKNLLLSLGNNSYLLRILSVKQVPKQIQTKGLHVLMGGFGGSVTLPQSVTSVTILLTVVPLSIVHHGVYSQPSVCADLCKLHDTPLVETL